MSVSPELKMAVARARMNGLRQYRLAMAIDVHPAMLSALLTGALPVRENDARVMRLGAALGVPRERCFAASPDPISGPQVIAPAIASV